MVHIYIQYFLICFVVAFTAYVIYERCRTRPPTESFVSPPTVSPSTVIPQQSLQKASPVPPLVITPADTSTVPLYYKPNDTEHQYPPVWIPVDNEMSKALQDYRSPDDPSTWALTAGDGLAALPVSRVPPDFADVFRGYQRLALLTIYLAFGANHKIIFVHKGNWHKLLPHLAGRNPIGSHFRSNAMSEAMRQDYIKSQILAYYGGYWCPPDTVIVERHLHAFLNDNVLKKAREDPTRPYDTPLLVIAGQQELPHDGATRFVVDSTFVYAEPRNPALLAIANQMQVIVTKSYDHGGYEYNNYFANTLHQYYQAPEHHAKYKSIVVLPPDVNGTIDDVGDPVKADHYFRQRPLEHLPHPNTKWFVVNSADNRITHYPTYEWFAYLSEEAIVQSQLWVSMLYRRALHMDSQTSNGNNYKLTVSLRDEEHPLRGVWVRGWRGEM